MTNDWMPAWAEFRRQHKPWLERHASSDINVLYRLPEAIIGILAQPLRYGRSILSKAAIDAEREFDKLCGQHDAEGVYHSQCVVYRHLRPLAPRRADEQYASWGYSDHDIAKIQEGLAHSRELQQRSRGYLGRLVTDPTFLTARERLREIWQMLPEEVRPGFPLRRFIAGLRLENAVLGTPALSDFQVGLEAFLDRYGLLSMVTWELPDPAGPLLDGHPKLPHLLAGRPVQVAVPAHFHFPDTDDLTGLAQVTLFNPRTPIE